MTDRFNKTSKQLERHLKGLANHRRLDILMLVAKREGITVEEISENLDCNFKTISMHTQKLVHAGLLNKSYKGRSVHHSLSPYGKIFITFLKTF
jgi:predicted transcriptional regulator